MIITQVQYTVQAGYSAQNQERIRRVMDELRTLGRTDIRYSVFLQEDGKTFIHLNICANEEAHQVFTSLETFQAFQRALSESQPEVPPVSATNLTLVDSITALL
jgi:quinol monooxygenase YgiN